MTPERWERIERLFLAARSRTADERASFLAEACAGDHALRREIEAMLGQPSSIDGIRAVPALAVAAQLLDPEREHDPGPGRATDLVGRRLGDYEVLALLGAGGMGEVYRVRDTRLGRDVAIKLLPDVCTGDPAWVGRFEREASLQAALNHPNVAAVYGREKAGGMPVLVMELVDGPTLAARIAAGPLPVEEACALARQIAAALEAAHERGIVHRDLKPSNVKIGADGTVKVLDFGLAKAVGPPLGNGPTSPPPVSPVFTTQELRPGVIRGTAAYMSPEQACGRAVDVRTDVWAFGCVLFEMLTGRPAFEREDAVETLASVLECEPDWRLLPADLPAVVRVFLERCLDKDPRQRVQAIGDVRLALDGAFDAGARQTSTQRFAPRRPGPGMMAVSAAAALLAVGIVAVWRPWLSAPDVVTRFEHLIPAGHSFARAGRPVLALAPDGRSFVYNTTDGLYLRRLGDLEARRIPGSEIDAVAPVFLRDGGSVLFWTLAQRLERLAVAGGSPVVVARGVDWPFGITWTDGQTLLVGQANGVLRVRADAGTAETIVAIAADEQVYGPQLLPGGDGVLFSVTTGTSATRWDEARIVVQSLSSGDRTVLIHGGTHATYLPTGHLIYTFGDGLYAVGFDADRLALTGAPARVVEGVLRAPTTGAGNYAVSDAGTLAYLTGSPEWWTELVWVDRQGREEPLGVPLRRYACAQLSPDGTRVVVDIRQAESGLFVWNLTRGVLERLGHSGGGGEMIIPLWTPDAQRIVYMGSTGDRATPDEIYWQPADGSGPPEPLTAHSAGHVIPRDISRDGRWLFYTPMLDPRDIWMVATTDPPSAGTPLLTGPANEDNPALSPDGRWLAYESDESGREEIYVRPFPDVEAARWQVSAEGGTRPRWRQDGSELFYFVPHGPEAGAVMAVTVEPGSRLQAAAPRRLFEGSYVGLPARQSFDVSSDGQRFLMIRKVAGTALPAQRPRVVVVQNWFTELEQLVPSK